MDKRTTGKIFCGESGVYVRIPDQPWHDTSVKGSDVQRFDEKDPEIWNGSRIKISLTAFILCHRDGVFWGSKETGDRNIVSMNSGSGWMIWLAVCIIVGISITSWIYAGIGRQSSQQERCPVKCKWQIFCFGITGVDLALWKCCYLCLGWTNKTYGMPSLSFYFRQFDILSL